MGVESSALAGCTLEDPLPDTASTQHQDWKIHPAKRSDGSRVSVFVHKHDEEGKHEQIYQHAAKQLKVLRHPTILKFFASCNNVDSTYLITEQVKPLELVIEMLSPEEICAGIYNVVEALSFLHDRGGVSHNNVCLSSIYVSSGDGGWRLGGMEHLCKFEDATLQFLVQSRPLRNSQAIPPEEKVEGIKTSVGPSIGHARDAYGFGVLALTLLEYLGDLGSISEAFSIKMEEQFLNPDPKLRPKMSTLLSDELFRNDFLDIMGFLNKLVLKNETEKNTFFEGLASHLYRLPSQLVASRLLTPITNSFVMAEPVAVSMVFPHLLTPRRDSKKNPEFLAHRINPILPLDMFQRHMIPVLAQVFQSREMHVRSLLLQHFSSYVDLFDEATLKNVVLPQLLLGLKDHHTNLVADSLRALADLVHILGPEVVVGGSRIKYFVEGRPKFPHKASKSSKLTAIPHLTAVSGVIAIPALDQTASGSDPYGEGTNRGPAKQDVEEEISETGVAVAEDAMELAARKEERERRREEMRLRNEQRRLAREEKRKMMMAEKENAPLSPRKEKLSSLAHRLSPEGSIDNGSFPIGEDTSPAELSPKGYHKDTAARDTGGNGDADSPAGSIPALDSTETGDDWSDWEDADQLESSPQKSPRIRTHIALHRTDSHSKDPGESGQSDWGSDWSQSASETSPQKASSPLVGAGKKTLRLKGPQTPSHEKQKPETASQKTGKTGDSVRSTVSKQTQEFGNLYEIPDFKVRTKPAPEDDLFADMEPSFSFSSKNPGDKSRTTGEKTALDDAPTGESGKKETLSFAVAETAEEETTGWGDDDWNLDMDDS
ncbi:protein-associating with the carboxyl-terminal domain of ezrin-like [Diadema antillarum]|uniref:protein-associating with the carboxyl-terminal domain of ezrin-like n=1 Tax=Diadema antillarum TaxID=105358 RepID=UPI003A854761